MRKMFTLAIIAALFVALQSAQAQCIDTVSNGLTLMSKSSFGGPDCLFSVRFCVKKTSSEAHHIDYAVSHTYGTMYRTIRVNTLPVGSIICETFTFVADCNSTASFVADGLKVNDVICGSVADYIVLPIKLIHFSASAKDEMAMIEWNTAVEENASHFVVQQSTDGKIFKDINSVTAKGTTDRPSQYVIEAKMISNARANYFRLKMVDRDGSFSFSPIALVNSVGSDISVYPNPAQESLNIIGLKTAADYRKVSLMNSVGQVVPVEINSNGTMSLDQMNSGIYYIKYQGQVIKFIKE